MLEGDMVAKISNNPSFDGMGRCTPIVSGGGKYIETAWMREMEFLCLDFLASLVGGRSGVHGEREERGTSWKGVHGRKGSVGVWCVCHGVCDLLLFVMQV